MASEAALNQRKSAKAAITRIINFLAKNEGQKLDILQYSTREEALNRAFEKFCEAQDEIDRVDSNPDETGRVEVEERYYDTLTKLKRLGSVHNSSPSVVATKMPEIIIEKFTGLQQSWASFFDIFQALVLNNSDLADVQKFIYLKSSLKGEPLKLVETLPLTSANLNVALKILTDRYQNKLATIYSHIKGLVELPSITKNNPTSLRDFVVSIKQNTESLKNLEVPIETWNLILVYILSQKLDFYTRKAYELERGPTQLPTLDNFLKFVERRCLATENLSSPEIKRKTTHFATSNSDIRPDNTATKFQNACMYCKASDHPIYKCSKFKDLAVYQRKQFVFNQRLCFKCLLKHTVNQCRWKNCHVCGQSHHFLLHPQGNSNSVVNSNQSGNNSHNQNRDSSNSNHAQSQGTDRRQGFSQGGAGVLPNTGGTSREITQRETTSNGNRHSGGSSDVREVNAFSTMASSQSQHVLIATATVLIPDREGRMISAKAILDNGSQTSLVTSNLVKRLNYKPYIKNVQVSGVSGKRSMCNQMVDFDIISRIDSRKVFKVFCSVMDRITCPLPQVTLNQEKLDIPESLLLADPSYATPSNIDLLLGADVYYEILAPGLLKLGEGFPVLQNTYLGWVIGGITPQDCISHLNVIEPVSLFTSTVEINDLMQKFWALEEVPNEQVLSNEEELSEQIFRDTTKILENGRFQVDIPLKTSKENLKLGESFSLAEKRFLSLERRLHKDKNLFKEYKEFIDEYVSLNHAIYVPLSLKNQNGENKYFMPHHCVIREDKTTTRLRVVFDSSMKTRSGYSLNDVTLKGFQTQPDLFDILCRFRSFLYTLVADIQKMFRQILINPSQTFLQNILWRDNPTDTLKCIELSTISYGTNFAPYVSTRCLMELANKNKLEFALAAKALKNQCYMDDILGGADTIDDLILIRKQLVSLLDSAGFTLHKWNSNCKEFLENFNEDLGSLNYDITSENHSNKILGISWNAREDCFSISCPNTININPLTKRNILSIIAQVYDPLGFVAPLIVTAKIFMQKIWLAKLGWDQSLSDELKLEWITFVNNISDMAKLKIPRCLVSKNKVEKMQLHGYADASLKAYGACLYLRVLYENGTVSCHLICSKSRVSPLRTVSLPRLELCACLLLARLAHKILGIFRSNLTFENVNLWSDSQISLCWIKSHPSRWNIFVSNRVAQIQELTSDHTWRHVRSVENAADYLTRGLSSTELINCTQWWHGPEYLREINLNLNTFQCPEVSEKMVNIPEQKKNILIVTTETDWDKCLEKFSCFIRLQRTIAFCLRFCSNVKPRTEKISGPLKVYELKNALNSIIKFLQRKYFSHELSLLKNDKLITDKGLLSLSPFLDPSGILRVGGRLSNAEIPYSQKYPILLPSKGHIVTLMLKREHIKLYHAGPQTVLSNFRLRFWPLNGLRLIKRIIRNCVICHRFKAQTARQIMADLPKDRVAVTRPFLKTGVDFGGPYLIKSSRLRRAPVVKGYIAIFVCMVTKCVHIELVSSLSTEAFSHTLKRFIARRGNPSIIYSDNATNFLGARNQLKELYDFFRSKTNSESIENFLAANEIQWKFIPPRSPHWGGIWEAAIKSAKYHLYRVIGNTQLTFEEFSTVLATVEGILNSRPLTALSNDPSDIACLTPGHFLIGDSLSAYPENDLSEIPDNRLSFWQKCVKIQQTFWKRWSIEYLNRLQNKPKWLSPSKNLSENQVVLLKEDNTPPLRWPLARIVEIIPGADGKVRVVKLRTKDGIFTRSIAKICPLPDEANFVKIQETTENI